jgi:hypothetical protein
LDVNFIDIMLTKFGFAGKVWSAHPRSIVRQLATAVSHAGEWQNQLVDLMARSTAMPAE